MSLGTSITTDLHEVFQILGRYTDTTQLSEKYKSKKIIELALINVRRQNILHIEISAQKLFPS